jgi:hypothetical protein
MARMIRAILHITLLLLAGAASLLTVTPVHGAESASPAIVAALEKAINVPGARLDQASEERSTARGCLAREVTVGRAIEGSGRVPVKVVGTRAGGARCEAWSWVRVRMVADVAVTRHAVRAGDALAEAVAIETRELLVGHPPAVLSPGAVAARAMPANTIVDADAATVATARPGELVKVLVMAGTLAVEQSGRAVPCQRARSCAILPSGRRVEGDLIDGRLVVTLP